MPETTGPYSRVYWTVRSDDRLATIYPDDRHLATWLRLLIAADMSWPAPADLPATARRASVAALEAAGVVKLLPGGLFGFHGLDAERGRRADAARVGGLASGRSRRVEHSLNGRSSHVELAETRRDETRQSRDEQDARDPWDDPEREAVQWLAKHGCSLPPHSGYYRHLVTMTETYGVNAIIGMFDRLAAAGTAHGDTKGFVFGAKDALDAQTRPDLKALEKSDREDEIDRDFQRRVEATQARLRELRGAT